jgi:hypothetical protein
MELLVMGANSMRRTKRNPMDNFTPKEKMHLGMMGIKWSDIHSPADVRKARASLKQFYKLRSNVQTRMNPSGAIVDGAEPGELAQDIYEGFHSTGAEKSFVCTEPHMPSGDYPQLGTLFKLMIKPMPAARNQIVQSFMPSGGKPIRVLSSLDRRKIYFAQGNQALSASDLEKFGADESNICELGELRAIVYLARKYHSQVDSEARGEIVQWKHDFGEDGGRRPRLFYIRDLRRLAVQGGDFVVKDEGIVG